MSSLDPAKILGSQVLQHSLIRFSSALPNGSMEKVWLRTQKMGVQFLALPQTLCVTLGKSLTLCVP